MGKWRYGVILDAGSSGTRVYVYRWLNSAQARIEAHEEDLQTLPILHTKSSWTLKIKPGISTFGENPTTVGPKHLKDLLDHALSKVPASQVADTPIFLMATAGMRLLPESQQAAILKEVCTYTRKHTKFSLPDCDLHIQVIPGETEGLYGWMAANYLLGGFDFPEEHSHGKGHHTYGFLDMGGASAQIAFVPNATESAKHSNDLKLLRLRTINGDSSEYKVFTTTWLGFGVNQARERYVEALMDASYTGGHDEILDPCLHEGLKTTIKGDVLDDDDDDDDDVEGPILKGTGLFDECLKQTYPLLDKDAPCADAPCLLHGQHVPAIDFDINHFVGVSEYWHTTHGVFEMSHKEMPYDFTAYQALIKEFCGEEWDDIEEGIIEHKYGQKVDARTAQEVCFKASWLINVLHDGIGIPRIGLEKGVHESGYNATKEIQSQAKTKGFLDPFQAVDEIRGMEVSWTLGKMILYAAGQIPSSNEMTALPVGFGSNVDGVPNDFQYAGSNSNPVPTGDDGDDDWSDELMEHAQSRSGRGVVFLVLLIVVCFFFRKRERRMRLYRGISTTCRRGRRPGSPRKGGRGFFSSTGMFGSRSSLNYERVLEDGDAADEFELADVDSEDNENSSDGSDVTRVGRSSGLATPKMNIVGYDTGSFGSAPGHAQAPGLGLGISGVNPAATNAMDRSGLVVRTDSRERLAPSIQLLGAGRRSRAGSPTRGKSPLMTSLEEE